MSLRIEPNIYISKPNINTSKTASYKSLQAQPDCFEPSFGKKEKLSLVQRIFRKYDDSFNVEAHNSDVKVSEFAQEISDSINAIEQMNIPACNFASIMSPEEFKELLPDLKPKNFKRSPENIENAVYCADLDYQSNYSSGKLNVYEILDKVAEQADAYAEQQRKNGVPEEEIKPFYFALSDRDSIEGIQQAVRIIGSEPEKFRNLKFIPALKLTYAHPADTSALGYENSDMLVYGINPYSKNLVDYLDNIISKRQEMVLNFIHDIYELYPSLEYTIKEFNQQNKMKYLKSFAVSNLYWRLREYTEGKGDAIIKGVRVDPKDIWETTNSIFKNMGMVQTGSRRASLSDPYASSIRKDMEFNKSIKGIFNKYSTHYNQEENKIVSAGENSYEDMIECLSKEQQKPVLALSAPIYLAHYFEEPNSKTFANVVKFIERLKASSNGMLCAFQSIVPNYGIDNDLNREKIKLFNT